MKRLFIGIPTNKNIEDICLNFIDQNQHIDTRWIPKQNWHITTLFIGDFPSVQINNLTKQLSEFYLKQKPFRIEFKQFAYVPNVKKPNMIWGSFQRSIYFDQTIYKTYNIFIS